MELHEDEVLMDSWLSWVALPAALQAEVLVPPLCEAPPAFPTGHLVNPPASRALACHRLAGRLAAV